MVRQYFNVLVLFATFGFGFQSDDPLKQVSPLKSGLVPPVMTYKIEPKYTDEAKDAGLSAPFCCNLSLTRKVERPKSRSSVPSAMAWMKVQSKRYHNGAGAQELRTTSP